MLTRPESCVQAGTRRAFLQTVAAGAALTACGVAPRPAAALEPVVRNGHSHMKLSLAAYSFRDQLGGDKPKISMLEFIDKCAGYNLDGCELTSYWFPKEITPQYLNDVKQRAFRLGLDISGTAIRNDFCLAPGKERDQWLAHTRQWIDYSATIGAPVIRVFAGVKPKDDTEAVALDRCVEGLKESLKYAAEKGVYLALENHGGITSTADQLLAIVERVDSPWFGINFDSGNFAYGGDPYEQLVKIAPYAVNAQIKSEMKIDGKNQPADLKRIIKILKDAHYRGYVVLEYEAAEDAEVAVPRVLKELRGLISG